MASAPPIDGRAAGRVPPSDLEAEQSVLGAILVDELAIIKVSEFLRPGDFYRKNHEEIYRAALELLSQGEPIDIVTVGSELEKAGVLERIGGRAYLAQLGQSVPTAANISYYGRIVKEKAVKRSLISAGGEIAGYGYDEALDSPDALNQAQKIVFDISEDRVSSDFEKLYSLLKSTMERVDALQNNKGGVVGVASGFYDLDAKTNGFKANELIVIAGRPSMGKTSIALNVALRAAVEDKVGVAIFSLEMSRDQLAERLLCEYARVDAQRLHRGLLGESEHERLAQALGPLGEAPIFIDDSPSLDELMLLTKSRRMKLQENIGMIVVDYLQLMHTQGRWDDNRVQEVSAISRSMKALARELKVPVIAISQLSRGPEQRTDKRPILSDLRECVVGSTKLVDAASGRSVPITELVPGQRVLGVDRSHRIRPFPVADVWSTGVKPVFEVETRTGRRITCTANHPLLTVDGWRRLDELSAGEVIGTAGDLLAELASSHVGGSTNPGVLNASQQVGLGRDQGKRMRPQVALLWSEPLEDADLRRWAGSDLLWEEISSIIPAGEEEVFDISIPGCGNFLADGIVAHNSGAIEQDADVVIFLYREGYYNKADTSGIAEVIIAKNRNGPTGTVSLKFRPELTRFENLDNRRRGPDLDSPTGPLE